MTHHLLTDPTVLEPLKVGDLHQNCAKSEGDDELGKQVEEKAREQIIEAIGPWGKWHWHKLTFMCCIIWIPASIHLLNMVFFRAETDHWCNPPDIMKNMPLEVWRNLSSPINDMGEYDRCKIYELDYEGIYKRHSGDISSMRGTKYL